MREAHTDTEGCGGAFCAEGQRSDIHTLTLSLSLSLSPRRLVCVSKESPHTPLSACTTRSISSGTHPFSNSLFLSLPLYVHPSLSLPLSSASPSFAAYLLCYHVISMCCHLLLIHSTPFSSLCISLLLLSLPPHTHAHTQHTL